MALYDGVEICKTMRKMREGKRMSMGVYIKGQVLPKKPGAYSMKIRLFVREDGTASIWGLEEYIPHEPLDVIPVPPHGRLIDADALIADLKRQCKEVFRIDAVSPDDFWITRNEAYNERLWTTWCESLYDYINAAPTVIPEEGET